MKKPEPLRSSSSRRETDSSDHHPTPNHAVDSIGCMAGVFHLISSKYLTRRKFLTFGRKQTASFSFSSPQQPNPISPARKSKAKNLRRLVDTDSKNGCEEDSRQLPRLSCQVPRSPTIPPELRRSNSHKSPECEVVNFLSPAPSVVARLMGLENAPPTSAPRTPESAVEKRRKLIGALEKCDGDLKTLRRIIEAVQCADQPETPVPEATEKCTDQMSGSVEQEQPSPVSVLQDFTESPPPSTGGWCSANRTENGMCRGGRAIAHQQQKKKPGENYTKIASFYYAPQSLFHQRSPRIAAAASPSPSRAMVEAVNEACGNVERGQAWETERVTLVIDDLVYEDLIEGFIKELMGCCRVYSASPLLNCKRKLRF